MITRIKESKTLTSVIQRLYRTPAKHLEEVGITNKNIVRNASIAELYEYAMLPYHKHSTFNPAVRDSWLTNTGALVAYSGKRMGRVPNEK